ncbi:hypothetical protein F1Z29_05565 [Clostridium perfringens]|nr:hypothetical protein [Clostridium perfringens]
MLKRDIDSIKHENKKLKFGDIIIEKSGGSPTQPVGRVVILKKLMRMYISVITSHQYLDK